MSLTLNMNVIGMFSIDGTAILDSPVIRGGTLVDSGAGDTDITLSDGGIAAAECLILATIRGAVEGVINVVHTSNTVKNVIVKDDGGVAADLDVDILILRILG